MKIKTPYPDRKIKDLTGRKYNMLTITSFKERVKVKPGKYLHFWNCVCDCGNSTTIMTSSLLTKKSCGCSSSHLIDLTGKRFERWSVLKRAPSTKTKGGQIKTNWSCQCDCGKVKSVYSHSLISGKSKSCGCISLQQKTKSPGASSRRNIYSCYRSKSIRQHKEFSLTEEEFGMLTTSDCFYCGSKPNNIYQSRSNTGDYIYNGIDRIDNYKGYITGNVVPSCKNCNLAKRSLSKDAFFNMVKLIYEKHCL